MNKNNLTRLLACKYFINSLNRASEAAGGRANMWESIKDKKLTEVIHILAPNGIVFEHNKAATIENFIGQAKEIEQLIELDTQLFIQNNKK